MPRFPLHAALALVTLVTLIPLGGCAPLHAVERPPAAAAAAEAAPLEHYMMRGPHAVATHENRELRLSANERVPIDVYLAAPAQKAPLLVFLHGHEVSKAAHGMQALMAASWGFHAISVQLPKTGPWIANGRKLARIASLIHRTPAVIDPRVDASRIVLVGHSFGAAAVAVALGEKAPAAGGILLDPAAPSGKELAPFLKRIAKPVMILGADGELAPTRDRDYFYEYVRGNVAEISLKDAGHEDAQYPSEVALQNNGFDPDATEALQITFVAAIIASAASLAQTGAFDRAWKSFAPLLDSGRLFDPKKK